MSRLDDLKALYMTPENLAQYKATTDKFLFVEYLTDLPMGSRLLDQLDQAFYKQTEGSV